MRSALSRVNAAIGTASEGLSEDSAAGGVLLIDNKVANPVSQVSHSIPNSNSRTLAFLRQLPRDRTLLHRFYLELGTG